MIVIFACLVWVLGIDLVRDGFLYLLTFCSLGSGGSGSSRSNKSKRSKEREKLQRAGSGGGNSQHSSSENDSVVSVQRRHGTIPPPSYMNLPHPSLPHPHATGKYSWSYLLTACVDL